MTTSTWTSVIVIACLVLHPVKTDGNVGCLLSKQICDEGEWCYDDFAFGHCMPSYERISIDSLYRYELETDALKQLEQEFRRLFTAGYRWTHGYTQCIVKQMLQTFRRKTHFDRKKCEENEDEDLERALKFLEAQDDIDPKDVALIKFEPSLEDPKSEYGDEMFIPSKNMYSHLTNNDNLIGVIKPLRRTGLAGQNSIKQKRKQQAVFQGEKEMTLDDNLRRDEIYKLLDLISEANEDDYPEIIPYPTEEDDYQFDDDDDEEEAPTWSFAKRKGKFDRAPSERDDEKAGDSTEEESEQLYFVNNQPLLDSSFIFDRAHRYDVKKPGPFYKVNNYIFQKAEKENEDVSSEPRIFQSHPFEDTDLSLSTFRHFHKGDSPVELTADGMNHKARNDLSNSTVNAIKRKYDYDDDDERVDYTDDYPNVNLNEAIFKDDLGQLFNDRNHLLHLSNRHEKMSNLEDVFPWKFVRKNPEGETFNPNINHPSDVEHWPKGKIGGIHHHSNLRYHQEPGAKKPVVIVNKNLPNKKNETTLGVSETEKRIFQHDPIEGANNQRSSAFMKGRDYFPKTIENKSSDLEIVDTSYAYIIVNKEFSDWKEGKAYAKKLETLLQLPPGTFSSIRQEGNQITFKVNSNSNGMTASDVASKAETLKDELQKITGKMLKSSGIGNKIHLTVHELSNNSQVVIITFIVCGIIAGLVLGVGVLYLILHHSRSKQKLQDITQVDTEASQDYQELCRQRMAIKSSEKPEPIQVLAAQRISGLSRESETSVHSPSSRSSTSSWNEEPIALNLDITTGHKVLAYMEDLIKNTDRMDKEWEGLCNYQAEFTNCDVANLSNNYQKNRYPTILPYDHSRVILNESSNAAGSDYINANTITDHDPRNAAYIATQGPLPHTSSDFWQMVWEQGSVVIVMLTRLVENGVAMCHRYWPEEGSELYHIYEVHLVSEHIWCEDYLIRSFYLKNLKTGETRTVTQFHFLSWPDMGLPVSAKMILDFRRKVNKSYRGRSCPIVVHCSDGCGRTGVYCLIDMVLNRMAKGLREIDIAATLEHILEQRMKMVQSKDQFNFVLMAIAEEVHSTLKPIP